jgi:16S rRNA (guanine527-N7)-methyltransferase
LESQSTKQLQQGCDQLGLPLDAQQLQQLIDYLALLAKWNRTYNLTSIRDEAQMVIRHLLDSLAISGHVSGQRVIDVGSGAGLPGVPLAIAFPDREFLLVDSNGKKTRFLFQVKTALRLDNMEVCQARVETLQVARPFDAVLSRAFASLQDMIRDCRHLLAPEGRLLAMKGAYPTQELESVCKTGASVVVHSITVPGLDEQRHLVEIALPQSPESPEQSSGNDH